MIKRILLYALFILTIAGIIYLTMMKPEATMALSNGFNNILVRSFTLIGIDIDTQWWNSTVGIRSLGHVIEYFVLGFIVGLAIKHKVIGLIVCIMVSITDQIVKIYVPVRHFDKRDIPFDVVGYIAGLLIAWTILLMIRGIKEIGKARNTDRQNET